MEPPVHHTDAEDARPGTPPVLLILGPSGVGKTTLAEALVERAGFLHVNFDRADGRTGVDHEGLRAEWNALLDERNPQPLSDAVRRRIHAGGKAGAVITCPSGTVPLGDPRDMGCSLPKPFLEQMRRVGIRCVVLYGPPDECMKSFLARPDGKARGDAYWMENNPSWFAGFRAEEFGEHVVQVFVNGSRRPLPELLAEVQRCLAG